MNKRVTCLLCALLALAGTACLTGFVPVVQLASAQGARNEPDPRARSCADLARIHQSHGKPTPSSGFAPRPGHSGRHVYGAPIQKPILKMQPKKPTPPKPKLF